MSAQRWPQRCNRTDTQSQRSSFVSDHVRGVAPLRSPERWVLGSLHSKRQESVQMSSGFVFLMTLLPESYELWLQSEIGMGKLCCIPREPSVVASWRLLKDWALTLARRIR